MGGGQSVLNKARKNPEGDEADIIYKTMDKDENGQLSAKEIIEAIKKKHSDWPVTEITETVKRFDVNNDGKISREEVPLLSCPRTSHSLARSDACFVCWCCPVRSGAWCDAGQTRGQGAREAWTEAA